MPGERRTLSEATGMKTGIFLQKDFIGVNHDLPASDIHDSELAKGTENVICRGSYCEGRPASALFANRHIPGSGTVWSHGYHQSSGKFLLHRGTQLWRADNSMSDFWEELKLTDGSSFGINTQSMIKEKREDFIISTGSGIYDVPIDSSSTSIVYKRNHTAPDVSLGTQGTGDHKYRVLYTHTRLTGTVTNGRITDGAVLEQESGTPNIHELDFKDYGEILAASAIDSDNPQTLQLNQAFTADDSTELLTVAEAWATGTKVRCATDDTLPSPLAVDTDYYVIYVGATTMKLATTLANAQDGTEINITDTGTGNHFIHPNILGTRPDHQTHVSIYITGDLSPDVVDPETNTGYSPNVFLWLADVAYVDYSAAKSLTIDTDYDTWSMRAASGGHFLKTRKMVPLPSGEICAVSGSWFLVAERDDEFLYYGQISDSGAKGTTIGYYWATQAIKMDEGIKNVIIQGDIATVLCTNSTYTINLLSYQDVAAITFDGKVTGNAPIFQLMTRHKLEGSIGVVDWATVHYVGNGMIAAVCSDASFRTFNGFEWSHDLSYQKMKSELRQFQVGSVAAYWQGASYIWYRKDSSDTYNTNCLRFAHTIEAGIGWAPYTGSNFIWPPTYCGPMVVVDSNDIQRVIVLDSTDKRYFWIETFDGYTGSGLSQTFIEKSDSPGICDDGDTYFYDAMDDDSQAASLIEGTAGSGSADEQNGRMELTGKGTDKIRVIADYQIGAGDDFEVEIYLPYQDTYGAQSETYDYELKLATFTNNDDDIDIAALTGDGIYVYVRYTDLPTDTYRIYYKIQKGATSTSANYALASMPTYLKITKSGTTVSIITNLGTHGTETNALWDTMGALKASFAYINSYALGFAAGFNYFSIISDSGMPNTCVGTDGVNRQATGKIRFQEQTGVREINNKVLEGCHAYLRAPDIDTGFPSFLKLKARNYLGSNTANETINGPDRRGDIEWFKEGEGPRIQTELEINTTQFRLTEFEMKWIEQYKKNIQYDITLTDEYTRQRNLNQDITHDFSKPNIKLDRADATLATQTGTFTRTTGPDSKSRSGFKTALAGTTSLVKTATQSYTGDFCIILWVKNPVTGPGKVLLTIAGVTALQVHFSNATTLVVNGNTWTVADVTDGEWHCIVIQRVSGQITVYQNKTSKGTNADTDTLGGGNVTLGGAMAETEFYHCRIYDDDKRTADLDYYYDDVIDNEAKVVMPYG
jgi:hypothetical protein